MINAREIKEIADKVFAEKKTAEDIKMLASLEVSIKNAATKGQYSLWVVPMLNKEVAAVLKQAGYSLVNDSPSQYPDDEQGTTIWWN